MFAASRNCGNCVTDNSANKRTRVGMCDSAMPIHIRFGNRPPDQMRTQVTDSGFDFREFGHSEENRQDAKDAKKKILGALGVLAVKKFIP